MSRAIPEPGDVLDVTLTVRFSRAERSAIEEVAEERSRALRHSGGAVTASDVVRGAVRRVLDERGKKARTGR